MFNMEIFQNLRDWLQEKNRKDNPTKTTRIDVRLDYENLHISLERKNGQAPRPEDLINSIQRSVADLGEVVNIVAYADWDLLSKDTSCNIQRTLAGIGVETRYQINMHHKNSADMKIADDIRTLMERSPKAPDAAEVIVLGTCDRDFRPIVQTARRRGQDLIILTLQDNISHHLLRTAKDNVRYLDKYLNPPAIDLNPQNPYIRLSLNLITWMEKNHKEWIDINTLPRIVMSYEEKLIQNALKDNLLLKSKRGDKVQLNTNHPLVTIIQYLVKLITGKINYCIYQRNMHYVDTKYLAVGMQMDDHLQQLQIGQSWEEATAWLDLLAQYGFLRKGQRQHHKIPHKTLTTWKTYSIPEPKPSETNRSQRHFRPVPETVQAHATI